MFKKFLLAVLVLIIIFVSGCLGPQPTSTGNGVIIEAFEPDFSRIDANEPVQLRLKIRNKGTVEAEIKEIKLSGADWLKKGECDIKGKLLPTVPSQGIEGETKHCSFEVTPTGKIPAGLEMVYNPRVEVQYNYKTNTVKSITVLTRNELRKLQDRGETLPAETLSTTSGPITIDIKAKSPIRVSGNSVTFPIEIKIDNIAGGDVSYNGDPNKINLKIDAEGLEDCKSGVIGLWKGKSQTIGCKIKVSNVESQTKKLIKVNAEYDYSIYGTTSVTVTGVGE